jgi:hypothetical protein
LASSMVCETARLKCAVSLETIVRRYERAVADA